MKIRSKHLENDGSASGSWACMICLFIANRSMVQLKVIYLLNKCLRQLQRRLTVLLWSFLLKRMQMCNVLFRSGLTARFLKRYVYKLKKLSIKAAFLGYSLFAFNFCILCNVCFVPHSCIASKIDSKLLPYSVIEYSTLGGTCGYTTR